MTLEEQEDLKKARDFHLKEYQVLNAIHTANNTWYNTEIHRQSCEIDKLADRLKKYLKYDQEIDNLKTQLQDKDRKLSLG